MAKMSGKTVKLPPLLELEPFAGIDLSVTPSQIDDHHSPDMLNMNIDERGALNKRTGYDKLFPTSLGDTGPITGLFNYLKPDGTTDFLIGHDTHLYAQTINLLGDAEDNPDKWTTASVDLTTDSANALVGDDTFKMTLTDTTGSILIDLPVYKKGYYVFIASVKNGNSDNMQLIFADTKNNRLVDGSHVTGTDYALTYVKISKDTIGNNTKLRLKVFIYGESGQYGYVDGLKVYRVSSDIYNKIDVDPAYTGANLPVTLDNNGQPYSVYSSLANDDLNFFVMNGNCYLMNGTDYLYFNGTNVNVIHPYVPTLTVSGAPTGGGTQLEDFNLIGSGFKEEFSGDGTSKIFQLSLKGLDSTAVTANVDAVDLVETTDFTVDRTNGKVTFNTAPADGTNNVIITAYKTYSDKPDYIKKCTFNTEFGGENDSHIFVSGNPDYPHRIWRSGVYDPTYWPENGFYNVGNDSEKVQGFSRQYDYLVIFKEHSIWNMQYQLNNGDASFPLKPVNQQVGTLSRKSIQLIDNNPTFLDSTGVYTLTSTNVRDETNIRHVSINIDPKLLDEIDLESAITVDFDRKYWLAVNGNVYVWDYAINEWYVYDNIPADCFLIRDNELYFGSGGYVYKFKDKTDRFPYNDDGVAISSYWTSKLLSFHVPSRLKMVERVFLGIKPDDHTSVDIHVETDKKGDYLAFSQRFDKVDFDNLDFSKFSFITSNSPQETGKKLKLKKINNAQFTLKNDKLDESLGILSFGIKYRYLSEVR